MEEELPDEDPDFLFVVSLDGTAQVSIFGDHLKRNRVLWKLSQVVLELAQSGVVDVKQKINGEWEQRDDWRRLAH